MPEINFTHNCLLHACALSKFCIHVLYKPLYYACNCTVKAGLKFHPYILVNIPYMLDIKKVICPMICTFSNFPTKLSINIVCVDITEFLIRFFCI